MAKECISYNNKLKFKLITLEINPEYHAIASEMIKLSGLDDMISIFEISYNGYHTNIVDLLREELKQNTIDMLFIDHDKDSYKSDLIRLEEAEFLRQGSRVVADNVIFAQIHDFVDYVQHRQKNGVVKTETVSCSIEYSNDGSNSLSAAEETSQAHILV
jgi:catechol O-methyltransferase